MFSKVKAIGCLGLLGWGVQSRAEVLANPNVGAEKTAQAPIKYLIPNSTGSLGLTNYHLVRMKSGSELERVTPFQELSLNIGSKWFDEKLAVDFMVIGQRLTGSNQVNMIAPEAEATLKLATLGDSTFSLYADGSPDFKGDAATFLAGARIDYGSSAETEIGKVSWSAYTIGYTKFSGRQGRVEVAGAKAPNAALGLDEKDGKYTAPQKDLSYGLVYKLAANFEPSMVSGLNSGLSISYLPKFVPEYRLSGAEDEGLELRAYKREGYTKTTWSLGYAINEGLKLENALSYQMEGLFDRPQYKTNLESGDLKLSKYRWNNSIGLTATLF